MGTSSRRNFLSSAAALGLGWPLHAFPVSDLPSLSVNEPFNPGISQTDDGYLDALRQELAKAWPNNRAVNLVFHGHSVPAGYFKTPEVNTLEAYPHLLLKGLKKKYPQAVINSIVTAIGGEHAKQGASRFKDEVLCHRPDLICIDYALNDQRIGLAASREAWQYMIESALNKNVKVILLTATPDQRVDIFDQNSILQQICNQIRELAATYKTALVDSYARFQSLASTGEKIADYMSQVNHPNLRGHELVAGELAKFF